MLYSTKKSAISCAIILILFLSGTVATPVCAQDKLEWQPFERALSIADSINQPIFVDVWAPWCGWCRKMKREVYPRLKKQLGKQFILSRINRDDNSTTYSYKGRKLTSVKLAQELKTQSVPAIVLLNAKGDYLLHLSGFIKSEKLRPILRYIGSNAYQSILFGEYKRAQTM